MLARRHHLAIKVIALRPEKPFTGVSAPSGTEIAKTLSSLKKGLFGVCRKVPENT